ncbi:sulfurtransferase [Microlunatus endophyticus]|uniref:Sulfurtransferase n=1 Tax=Microlunatus endophyticus TaxID=1716077 RepID=A0A917S3Q4_9ACTN|nr:sulfurtransferase [Microlunatus endophyticus]GGL51256.1 sulfurtransferase [Microlunatus endophyticus]
MGVLIEVDELAALLDSAAPGTVLDVRWTLGGPSREPDFLAGHVPGARWVDLENDLSDHERPGGRHPLPEQAHFESAMRRAGVRSDLPVIVYDADNGLAAARLWWMLTDAGHGEVRVLNGGYAAWIQAGQPTEDGPGGTPLAGDFIAHPGQLPRIDGDQLAARVADGTAPLIIDVRGAERYAGESEPIDPVAGHVPGAVNVPSMVNVDGSGRFRAAAEIAAHFPEAGTEDVVYCGSGITAAHTALARASAGLPIPTIYPGSWSDWITDPDRPVATGDKP